MICPVSYDVNRASISKVAKIEASLFDLIVN